MNYLLDSNTIIDIGLEKYHVADRFRQTIESYQSISVITLAEIRLGLVENGISSYRYEAMMKLLSYFKLLEINKGISEMFANIKYELKKQGNIIPDLDIFIAATAIHKNLILVTADSHFKRIPGLKIENWRQNSLST